jgi:hypothetical protein
MFLIVESKNSINKYTKNLIKMSKTGITCGMIILNNYTFLKIFFHFSQRIRHVRIRISILSKFQKNLSSSFLKCGGIRSLSQRYYPRICPMRLSALWVACLRIFLCKGRIRRKKKKAQEVELIVKNQTLEDNFDKKNQHLMLQDNSEKKNFWKN